MDQFEHVMVLISVIIGIGIAQILLGLGRIVDRSAGGTERLGLSVAYFVWLAHIFMWMVTFWWWQFRVSGLDLVWTLELYLFLILYSVSLFLLAVILIPPSERRIESLQTFFLERRHWFYSMFLLATAFDIGESLVKGGWDRVLDQGPWVWSLYLLAVSVGVIGLRSRQAGHHNVLAITYFLWFIAVSFVDLPTLGV